MRTVGKGDSIRACRGTLEPQVSVGQRQPCPSSSGDLVSAGGKFAKPGLNFSLNLIPKFSNLSWEPINQSVETDSSQVTCILITAFWKPRDCPLWCF